MPLVLGSVGVGAGQHEAVVGELGLGGPDLLAVDDPLVAVEHGRGLERSPGRSRRRARRSPGTSAIVPARILGRKCFFCSSVPHWRMVGPTRVSPKKSAAHRGALALANSSASTTPCMVDRPLPPYSSGQVAQIQPPSKSLAVHSSLNFALLLGGHREALVEPAGGQVLLQPGADLDAELLGLGGVGQVHPDIVPLPPGSRPLPDAVVRSRSDSPAMRHRGRHHDTATPPAKAKAERWSIQWKELYAEVITSGLCTGCAGCVISCPHDVIGYDHERAATSRSTSRTSSAPTTASTARRAARPAPGPAPASGVWEPQADEHLFGRDRGRDEVAGIYERHPADPGQRRHGPPDGPGRRPRVGHPHLGDGPRLHRRRAGLLPRGRPTGQLEGRCPGVARQPGRGPGRRPAAATRTRPTPWPSTRRSRRALERSRWSA